MCPLCFDVISTRENCFCGSVHVLTNDNIPPLVFAAGSGLFGGCCCSTLPAASGLNVAPPLGSPRPLPRRPAAAPSLCGLRLALIAQ
jgi:hypothetical protein